VENQIEIFVIVTSIFLGLFILNSVYLVIKLKLNDMLLQKSEKNLRALTESLQHLVESQTRDIKISEKKYKNLYEFNKEVLEQSPAAIIKLDVNWDIEFYNREAKKLLHPKSGDSLNIIDLKTDNSLEIDKFMNSLEDKKEVKKEFTNKINNSLHHYELRGVPLTDKHLFSGAVLVIIDTTQQIIAKENLRKSFVMLQKATEDIIMAMANTSEKRDPYTAGHQKRVQDLALAIAKELKVSHAQLEGIKFAGIIHDIGKIAVPSDILAKPGNITPYEYEVIKSHSAVGYELLSKIEFPWPIAEIVYQHHERIDGTGYPQGLKRDEILLEAQILSVADIVEAMVSHRPYRPALGLDKALQTITDLSGTSLAPEIVDVCIDLIKFKGYTFVSNE
jgi:putative nucleotidyltransferase with HDIG domain